LTGAHHQDPEIVRTIEAYVDEHFGEEGFYVSAKVKVKKLTFSPSVFDVPPLSIERDLIAVMMPFEKDFDSVYGSIRSAVRSIGKQCLRADDIWEESVIVQDIFNLIFRASIVVADLTARNPNVMYEVGIAHTLGKQVVPITQSMEYVPFDLRHHRALLYLCNG
jgi:hypothetical protein